MRFGGTVAGELSVGDRAKRDQGTFCLLTGTGGPHGFKHFGTVIATAAVSSRKKHVGVVLGGTSKAGLPVERAALGAP